MVALRRETLHYRASGIAVSIVHRWARERSPDVSIIDFDALPEAPGSVRDGGLAATIEPCPAEQLRTAMPAMVAHLRNGTTGDATP